MLEEPLIRGWENLIGRWDGPMNFRLILQPAVAIFLAVRAGLRDARNGRPPFLWTVLSKRCHRSGLLQQAWTEVKRVFIVALVLDSIYQVIDHKSIYALEMLATATILAIVPYVLVRGLVTRIAQLQTPKTTSGDLDS